MNPSVHEEYRSNEKNPVKFLVIAEKPSVAQALAKVLRAEEFENGYLEGEDCIVSWCIGHLAEYARPEAYDERYQKWEFGDLPIIPENWKTVVSYEKKAQFDILKNLLNQNDLKYVVNACDAGREGELIFRLVYDRAGCRLPVKRLWISSMEDTSIHEGFAHLKEGNEYAGLCEASICRAKADWLIGMNATRAFTTKYYKRMAVGRVQTPTLAMLVERQDKINNFVKEAYYKVTLEGKGLCAVSGNIKEKAESDILAERCKGSIATITKVEKVQKKNLPPKLYDLTTLQREANRIFGYTAQETLKELQELYEAKVVTYPRTDSQYITSDMEGTALELLTQLPEMLPFLRGRAIGNHIERIINNEKVSDHHALLLTKEALEQEFEELSEKQQNIFRMIGQRMAQAVSEEYIYEDTLVTVSCEGHEFYAKVRAMIQPGFKEIEKAFRNTVQNGNTMDQEAVEDKVSIPEGLSEGMEIPEVAARTSMHFTSAPKPYSEDTLLAAMESAGNQAFDRETEKKGLGTPATRAAIIEKLVSSGYAQRKGKQIIPTIEGRELISVLPDYLKSAAMTAEWENQLLLVEKGQLSGESFLQGISKLIQTMLEGCGNITMEERSRFYPKEEIGTCPVCGSPIYESKKAFGCSNKECFFVLWKDNRFLANMKKSVDKKIAMELLKTGRIRMKDLYSKKTGNNFTADLVMRVKDGKPNFYLEFPKKRGGNRAHGKK